MASDPALPDIEATMRFDPLEGLLDLDESMARLKDAAARRGFAFDRHSARNELHAATFRLMQPSLVRLVVGASGAIAIEVRADP